MVSVPQVLLDGALHTETDARISATGEGFLYGQGVFETVKIIDGRPAFFARHHTRLLASARALDLGYDTGISSLRERLARIVAANQLSNGSVKIVVFDNGGRTGELLLTRANVYTTERYQRGFRIKTVPAGERTGSLSAHKTLNYLANIRAKRAATAEGYDEPLFVTPAGLVIEGATTNIFLVRDGIVHTSSLACGPLPGIARAEVLASLGDSARETLLTNADLRHADEIFVTNALLGVMPVASIDEHLLSLDRNPVTKKVIAAYRARETASLS